MLHHSSSTHAQHYSVLLFDYLMTRLLASLHNKDGFVRKLKRTRVHFLAKACGHWILTLSTVQQPASVNLPSWLTKMGLDWKNSMKNKLRIVEGPYKWCIYSILTDTKKTAKSRYLWQNDPTKNVIYPVSPLTQRVFSHPRLFGVWGSLLHFLHWSYHANVASK